MHGSPCQDFSIAGHQAGNSIIVNVLVNIFTNLFEVKNNNLTIDKFIDEEMIFDEAS